MRNRKFTDEYGLEICNYYTKYGQKKTIERYNISVRLLYNILHRNNIPLRGMKGKNHPAWKNGISPKDHRLRNTARYKVLRGKIFERDNYQCKICDTKGVGRRLNTHHIYPTNDFPELIYDLDNVITLCVGCHNYFKYHEESFIDFFERITNRKIFI